MRGNRSEIVCLSAVEKRGRHRAGEVGSAIRASTTAWSQSPPSTPARNRLGGCPHYRTGRNSPQFNDFRRDLVERNLHGGVYCPGWDGTESRRRSAMQSPPTGSLAQTPPERWLDEDSRRTGRTGGCLAATARSRAARAGRPIRGPGGLRAGGPSDSTRGRRIPRRHGCRVSGIGPARGRRGRDGFGAGLVRGIADSRGVRRRQGGLLRRGIAVHAGRGEENPSPGRRDRRRLHGGIRASPGAGHVASEGTDRHPARPAATGLLPPASRRRRPDQPRRHDAAARSGPDANSSNWSTGAVTWWIASRSA